MKPNFHISDADLHSSIFEGTPQCSMEAIESHIGECDHCRQRLEDLAASSEWRGKIRHSLQDTVGPDALNLTAEHRVDRPAATTLSEDEKLDLRVALRELAPLLTAASHPEFMGRIGRYDIETVVGRGGMGVVVKGFDTELHRPVAIKIMLPRWAANGTARQRFAREARAAAAMLHPNVIAIHGVDEVDDVPYLVMPYIAGPSLQTLVESAGPLPERDIVRIAMQIASGLGAAHAQGLVHRDIKPANILVDNHVNRVLITDFGLVRAEHDASMTQTGWIAGTPNFMSPEQSRGADVDARSDLFSLGSLLYFLATGTPPFAAETPIGVLHRIGNDQPVPVQKRNEEISSTLQDLIARLMDKRPESRFQSAAELESYLEQYIAYLHRPTDRKRPPKLHSMRRKRRSTELLIGTFTLSLATILFAVWSWGGPGLWNARPKNGELKTSNQPVLAWPEIQEKYQLLDSLDYDKQLRQLWQETEALQHSLIDSEPVGRSDPFFQQVDALQRQMTEGATPKGP